MLHTIHIEFVCENCKEPLEVSPEVIFSRGEIKIETTFYVKPCQNCLKNDQDSTFSTAYYFEEAMSGLEGLKSKLDQLEAGEATDKPVRES